MWRGLVCLQENEHVRISQHPCPHCDKTYSSGWDLKNHIKVVHGPDKVKCPDCKLCFAKKYNLREHVKTGVCNPTVAASYREQNKCAHCDRSFSSLRKHKVHMSNVHFSKKNIDLYEENLKEDRDWEKSVLTNFSPIKLTQDPEKTNILSKKEKSEKIQDNVFEIENIDNNDETEEETIEIHMETNQVFNIDSLIQEVSIDTMEEGEMIYKASIRSYITEQGETTVNGLD